MATPSSKSATVAVAQFSALADIAANLATIERLTARAVERGAELIVFPEASIYAPSASATELTRIAQNHSGPFEDALRAIASSHRISMVAGTYVPGESFLSRNALLQIDRDGKRAGFYQKLHLYDAFNFQESSKNETAELKPDFGELVCFDVGPLRFGLINCYDLRFPEMARALVDKGANVLLVSAAWLAGPQKEMHWEILLRARAIENTCYVAASCQPAPSSVGLSMIVDPTGLIAATVADAEGIAVFELELDRLASVRQVLPCLAHRRYTVKPNPTEKPAKTTRKIPT